MSDRRRWQGSWRFAQLGWLAGLLLAAFGGLPTLRADAPAWQPTFWREERAFEATCGPWRAVVSVERGRLVHLGLARDGRNLLFQTATRDHPQGWGGHRVWLGPQSTWPSGGWPPPVEWEKSPAREVRVEGGRLELDIASVPGGWPGFTRIYRWQGDQLVCGIDVHPDGGRVVQVVQILQVPMHATVELTLVPDDAWPAGYVGLPAGRRLQLQGLVQPPPQLTLNGAHATLRHTGSIEKLGFRPQPLRATVGTTAFTVGRGAIEGSPTGEADEGFTTQVYLGGPNTFIELEQLSPLWGAGTPALFEMVVAAKKP